MRSRSLQLYHSEADSKLCPQATLLLPAEKLDSPAQLTPAFLLDHVVLLDAPSSAPPSHHLAIERGFATLNGLRGVLTGGELVFTSCGGLVREGETAERDLAKDETLRCVPSRSTCRSSVS